MRLHCAQTYADPNHAYSTLVTNLFGRCCHSWLAVHSSHSTCGRELAAHLQRHVLVTGNCLMANGKLRLLLVAIPSYLTLCVLLGLCLTWLPTMNRLYNKYTQFCLGDSCSLLHPSASAFTPCLHQVAVLSDLISAVSLTDADKALQHLYGFGHLPLGLIVSSNHPCIDLCIFPSQFR